MLRLAHLLAAVTFIGVSMQSPAVQAQSAKELSCAINPSSNSCWELTLFCANTPYADPCRDKLSGHDANVTEPVRGASNSAPASLARPNDDLPSKAVPMSTEGGTYLVPVRINNAITLKFIVDSGAADVSIPADVVSTLIRAGTITAADFIGTQTYTLADGSKIPARKFRIRSLQVGETTLQNVSATVSADAAALLLGQSFLGRFKSWTVDNVNLQLILQ